MRTGEASRPSVLIVTSPAVGLMPLGRQVLGEVPALAFLMLGFVLWRQGIHRLRPDVGRLIWASVAFGLVAMTKNQFSLVLLPTLVILFAVDRVYQSLEGLMQSGVTIVLVEQDLARAMRVASRVICLLEGRVVLEGPTATLRRERVTEAYFGLGQQRVPA